MNPTDWLIFADWVKFGRQTSGCSVGVVGAGVPGVGCDPPVCPDTPGIPGVPGVPVVPTTTATAGLTLIVTLSDADPPGPVQFIVAVYVPGGIGLAVMPLFDVPVNPPGVTVQAVALVDVQLPTKD